MAWGGSKFWRAWCSIVSITVRNIVENAYFWKLYKGPWPFEPNARALPQDIAKERPLIQSLNLLNFKTQSNVEFWRKECAGREKKGREGKSKEGDSGRSRRRQGTEMGMMHANSRHKASRVRFEVWGWISRLLLRYILHPLRGNKRDWRGMPGWKGGGETSPLERQGPLADPHLLSGRGLRNSAGRTSMRRSSPAAATWAGTSALGPRRVWLGLRDNCCAEPAVRPSRGWRGASGPAQSPIGAGPCSFRRAGAGTGRGKGGGAQLWSRTGCWGCRAAARGYLTSVHKVLNALTNSF